MHNLRAAWRLLRVCGHILRGLAIIVAIFPRIDQPARNAHVQRWAHRMLQVMGIRLVVHGQPVAHGPALLVANHISWADIVVMHASRHCRFISKDEIRSWPVVGTLADAASTLYIARNSRRDARRMVQDMAASLAQGDILAVFPEGTTSDGRELLPFHANLLQGAIDANAPVQPVALSFADRATGQTSFAPIYVGDDTLMRSLWRTLGAKGIDAVVHYGPIQPAAGRERRSWSATLRKDIAQLRTAA